MQVHGFMTAHPLFMHSGSKLGDAAAMMAERDIRLGIVSYVNLRQARRSEE